MIINLGIVCWIGVRCRGRVDGVYKHKFTRAHTHPAPLVNTTFVNYRVRIVTTCKSVACKVSDAVNFIRSAPLLEVKVIRRNDLK
jgi:hypothetical protein